MFLACLMCAEYCLLRHALATMHLKETSVAGVSAAASAGAAPPAAPGAAAVAAQSC